MDMVPLREHLEELLKAHQEHVDKQFTLLRSEMRLARNHTHDGKVSWTALISILIPLVAAIIGLAIAI